MPGKPVFKITVYYLTAFLQGVCLILVPAASFIFKANAITDQQYGFLFLPMIAGAITVTVSFKALVKGFGTEKIYHAGFLANTLYLAVLWFADRNAGSNPLSFTLLLGANLFLGIGFGLLVSVLNLLCVELFAKNRDSILTGLHSFLGIGASMSPLLVSFFYARGKWTVSLLLILGGLFTLLAVSTVLRAAKLASREPAREIASDHAPSSQPLPSGAWMFLVTVFFYGIIESIIGNWSPIYLNQERGFSLQTASFALSAFWMFVTIGRILATFLAIPWGSRVLYRFSPVFMAVSLLAIVLTRTETQILFFYAAVGLGCSYFFPFSISLSTQYFNAWRDQLASMAVAALMLGVGIGSSLVGFLRNRRWLDLNQAFMTAAGCAVILTVTAFLMTRGKLTGQKA